MKTKQKLEAEYKRISLIYFHEEKNLPKSNRKDNNNDNNIKVN